MFASPTVATLSSRWLSSINITDTCQNTLSHLYGGSQCLRQPWKYIFGLVWAWPLTFYPQSWSLHDTVPNHLCQFASTWFIRFQNIMFTSLVTNGRTNERTDGRRGRKRYASVQSVHWSMKTITAAGVNLLHCKGNYSATLNKVKLVHWRLTGKLLHLVQRGRIERSRSPPRLLLAVSNVHPSTARIPITVLLSMVRCSAVLMCPLA